MYNSEIELFFLDQSASSAYNQRFCRNGNLQKWVPWPTQIMASPPNIFQKQKDPPKYYRNPIPKYCLIDNHHHVMFFQNGCVMLYNLEQQNITKQYQYPTNVYYDADRSCIDHENNILYIADRNSIISLDIMENKWSIFSPKDANERSTCSQGNSNALFSPKTLRQCHFIPSPMNELHVMTVNDHCKYNQSENTIINLQNRMDSYPFNPFKYGANTFYRKSTQQLFMHCPGAHDDINPDEILICDANIEDESWSKWRKYEPGLPPEDAPVITYSALGGLPALQAVFAPSLFDQTYKTKLILLVFDQILFYFEFVIRRQSSWFSGGSNSSLGSVDKLIIWCLDLDHHNKWYPTTHALHFKGKAKPHVIKDDDNNVHLIRFDQDNQYHLKASLAELMPLEIINLNQHKWDILGVGYIKRFEKKNKIIFIPMYLKKIIVKYNCGDNIFQLL